MDKVALLGYQFDNAESVTEVADELCSDQRSGVRFLITPNAYIIQLFRQKKHAGLFQFSQKASWVLPDGMPIVWLSRLKYGTRGLKSRITGSDLFPVLFSKIKKEQFSVLFVVPNDIVASKLTNEYDRCTCIVPKFFDPADQSYIEMLGNELVLKARENNARFIFIGLSDPKQTLLCAQVESGLSAIFQNKPCTLLLLGASYEFYYGLQHRAPECWRKSGFEWLYRLGKEPRRLWKRYTIGNLNFLLIALRNLFDKT